MTTALPEGLVLKYHQPCLSDIQRYIVITRPAESNNIYSDVVEMWGKQGVVQYAFKAIINVPKLVQRGVLESITENEFKAIKAPAEKYFSKYPRGAQAVLRLYSMPVK